MEQYSGENRRVSQDLWVRVIRISTIVAWSIFTIALIVSYYAAPENEYGVLRYHGIEVRKFWLSPLTGYLYVLLWVSAALSYLTLIVHKYRSRRKTDNSQYNILLLFIISVSWTIYIVIQLVKY